MPGVSVPRRASKGPYRPTRDPQVLLLVGIVLAVVGLWVVGVASPATLPGGESGPVFPFTDQTEDGVLEVSVNESTMDPGGTVAVSVTVNGNPASGASVSVAGESYETDGDGKVVVSLWSPGAYEVSATGPEGNRSAATSVRVRRYRTTLDVSVPDGAVTNESVRVRVTRGDGEPVAATVRAAGQRASTGADGVANVCFETAGAYAVRASKPKTDEYVFADGAANVSVDRRVVGLRVSTSDASPRVDEPVTVTVRRADTNAPVNATLSVGNRTVRTGADGAANASFDAAGRTTVRASATRTPAVRFERGTARVDVERIPVALAVSVSPDPVPEGERATFVVRRTDTGERVPASVSLYGSTYATGDDGRASFPFYTPGNVTVVASKPSTSRYRFGSANATFLVDGPEVVVESLSVPASAPANDSMRVNATLSNVGTAAVDDDAVVSVGSATTRTRTALAAGETRSVSWVVATPSTNASRNASVVIAYEEVVVERTVRLVANESTNGTATNGTTTNGTGTNETGTNETTRTNALVDGMAADGSAMGASVETSVVDDAAARPTFVVVG